MPVMTIAQAAITLAAACVLGLPVTVNILLAVLITTLTSFLFIGIGLLCGSLMNDKSVLAGDFTALLPHIAIVFAYTVVIYLAAVLAFRKKMSGDK